MKAKYRYSCLNSPCTSLTAANELVAGSLAGGIVGVGIGIAFLYTAILLVVILLVYCINKRRYMRL